MSTEMMNFDKYYKQLDTMCEPVKELPKVKQDLRGMVKYAKEQKKKVTELTKEEVARFIG